jgi:hypothetical protein
MKAVLKSSVCGLRYLAVPIKVIWRLGPFIMSVLFFVGVCFAILFVLLDTRRDVAYRYSAPGSAECNARLSPENSTILASESVNNDEQRAVRQISQADPKREDPFTCMLQLHAMKPGFVPENQNTKVGNPSLGYYFAFLEFEENGNPVQTGTNGKLIARLQIDALLDHLTRQKKAGRQNFVFAFVHGWRHDARIGDDNVRNARLMTAHLSSFLEQRCKTNERYCGATVTAVYVGWRGARVDEQRLDWLFHGYFSGLTSTINNALASMTLFDRKPVSERIAPSVISALREIDRQIHDNDDHSNWFEAPRLIVVGHSLGGNLLATGLKDSMIGIVDKNLDAAQKSDDSLKSGLPRPLVKSPLGDLVVLLNPASEAEKWFAIQRAFSRRVNAAIDTPEVQNAYSVRQPPIYMSLTAARSWPANGIHLSDVSGFEAKAAASSQPMNSCSAIRKYDADYKPSYDYDTATYDLFPFFKFDFRPLAQTIEDLSNPNPFDCNGPRDQDVAAKPNKLMKVVLRGLSASLRNAPFLETNVEQTRTIGHVDPMRPPYGLLDGRENDPATWFGTTHELLINAKRKQKPPGEESSGTETASYIDAGSPEKSECAVVDHWLTTARMKYAHIQRAGGTRVNWDSGWSSNRGGKLVPGDPNQPNLTKIRFRPDDPPNHIEGQIRQTLYFSGMRSIIGANDPFWNIRAFESAMTSHNGYVSYPLICSIFQFVMDKVTDDTAGLPPKQ